MKTIEDVIKECQKLSFEDTISFPEVIMRLAQVGVERYYVDLVRLEKTSYCEGIESYRHELPLDHIKIEEKFCEEDVRDALLERQHGEINYATFLYRIMQSGVVSYTVFIKSGQVHYTGGKGDFWIQHFPRK